MPNNLFATPRHVTKLEDCIFYHTIDLPEVGTIAGYWDIRGKESQYLGEVSLAGRRVLEIGPASGQLSFFMERQGAEVVSIDAADDYPWEFSWDFYDAAPADLQELLTEKQQHMEKVKNSYWFCHRLLGSKAKIHYGSAYLLPRELGRFDISGLACVLLHNKNPVMIIENCARLTTDTIVIVEPVRERQFSPLEFLPTGAERWWDTWWGFSPKFFVEVLRSMGFSQSVVSFHTQVCFGKAEDLFTVVATRTSRPTADVSIAASITSPVERLRVPAQRLFHLPVRVVNLGPSPISSFGNSPLLLSYHWKQSDQVTVWDGARTSFSRPLREGDVEEIFVAVYAPSQPGDYLLEISILREGVEWFDEKIAGLPLRIAARVTADVPEKS